MSWFASFQYSARACFVCSTYVPPTRMQIFSLVPGYFTPAVNYRLFIGDPICSHNAYFAVLFRERLLLRRAAIVRSNDCSLL